MTLPASGALGFNNIESEVGKTVGSSLDMAWVKANAKTTVGGGTGVVYDMNTLHGKAWYQSNNYGNCNNGNCSSTSSSGNKQCQNCTLTTVNCANCDTTSYLQPNCNCACTYNCNQNANQSYNCDCQCQLFCACVCSVCSDSSLKHSVTPITNALSIVDQLQGVYYKWNQLAGDHGKTPNQLTVGVIADDTQKVFPEVVTKIDGVLAVDYPAMNSLFIEAIKELKLEIETLKKGN